MWIDDVRPAPEGYIWCKSVNGAKWIILMEEKQRDLAMNRATARLNAQDMTAYKGLLRIARKREIELIDIDHDLVDYAADGGDGVKLLDWLEETGRNYPIRIHSANPVGVANMRAIIQRNNWKEEF